MIPEIAQALERSTEKCLEERTAIAFSGGLDSSTLATIAKKRSEVLLFSAGTADSPDLAAAETVAKDLGLLLEKIILDEGKIISLYEKIHSFHPAPLPKIEIGIPIMAACEAAAKRGLDAILFGSGAEELFVGYERYYVYLEEGKDLDSILKREFDALNEGDVGMVRKIAYKCGLEARFPFCDRHLASLVFQIPLQERMAERELKKGILREAGKLLGVPESALGRRKKAAQYGSGVHKIVMKNSDALNIKFPEPAAHSP